MPIFSHLPLITKDTVDIETSASVAISFIVIFFIEEVNFLLSGY